MPGTLIISFDCEGRWGVSDNLNDFLRSALTNENLNQVYEKIINILNRWGIKATFAFVGALTMSIEEYQGNKEWFSDVYIKGKPWLYEFKKDIFLNQFDGWFNPIPFGMVARESQHEIAGHGFCHLPLSESLIAKRDFVREIDLFKNVSSFRGRENMTFVYPRNLIGYTQELKEAGFIGYRNGIKSNKLINNKIYQAYQKARSLLKELNIKEPSQLHSLPNGIICIPSGVFFNWRHGFRKMIPMDITIRRWHNIINDAIINNKVIHLYSHPHNFISGSHMFTMLDEVLKIMHNALQTKELINQTQKEYAEAVMGMKNCAQK